MRGGKEVETRPRWPLRTRLLLGVALLTAAVVVLAFLPSGRAVYAPAAPVDVATILVVDGRLADPLQGRLGVAGASQTDVSMLRRVVLGVRRSAGSDVAGAEDPGGLAGQPDAPGALSDALRDAGAVGFGLAHVRLGLSGIAATVGAVEPGSPADGHLLAGDIVLEVNGTPVDTGIEAAALVDAVPAGERVTIRIRRAGDERLVRMTTEPSAPGDPVSRSTTGAVVESIGLNVQLPHRLQLAPGGAQDASAGLALAVYVADLYGREDLLRGRHVSAIGRITPEGRVLDAPHVRLAAIGAQRNADDLLLVPFGELAAARDAVAAECGKRGRCTRVVPVRDVQGAATLLRDDSALDTVAPPAG